MTLITASGDRCAGRRRRGGRRDQLPPAAAAVGRGRSSILDTVVYRGVAPASAVEQLQPDGLELLLARARTGRGRVLDRGRRLLAARLCCTGRRVVAESSTLGADPAEAAAAVGRSGTRARQSGSSSHDRAARRGVGAERAGELVARSRQRCSVTPRTRWSSSRRRAPPSRSRTPYVFAEPASPHRGRRRQRSPCTNGSGSRGPRSCRSSPRPPPTSSSFGTGRAARLETHATRRCSTQLHSRSPADLGIRRPGSARQRRHRLSL